jgi:hypothetical protein
MAMTKEEARERLGRSRFRSRFRLDEGGLKYIERVGMEKWWKVKRGVALSSNQQQKAVAFLLDWIARQR